MKTKLFIILNLFIGMVVSGQNYITTENSLIHSIIKDQYGRIIQNEKGVHINYSQLQTEEAANSLLNKNKDNDNFTMVLPSTDIKSVGNNACDAIWKYPIIGNLTNRTMTSCDIDNDGQTEIITCMNNSSSLSYWYILKYNSIAAKYESIWISELCSNSITSIKTADLNADGYPEIIIGYSVNYSTGKIQVYNSQSKELINEISLPGAVKNIEYADGDNDASNEIIISDGTNLYFYTPTTLTLQSQIAYGCYDFKIGDVDGDANLEIVLSSGKVIQYLNNIVTTKWIYDSSNPTTGFVALSDIDSDGEKEIVKAKSWDFIDVYDADLQTLKYEIATDQDISSLLLCDVNSDGIDEIIYGDAQWGSIFCYNSITHIQLWEMVNPEWGAFSLCAGNFKNDGVLRLMWSSNLGSSNSSRLLTGNTVSHVSDWINLAIDGPFTAVEIDDVDGDGIQEIVTLSKSSDSNYESGILTIFNALTKAMKWQSNGLYFGRTVNGMYNLEIEDIDNDGTKEIIVVSDTLYTGKAWIINGVTKVKEKNYGYFTENLDSFYTLAVADIDNDGINEIIAGEIGKIDVINPVNMSVEWSSSPIQNNYGHYPIYVTDVDNDSVNEIIVSSSYLYIIDGNTHQQVQSTNSNYTAISIADIDNDGNKEIIAGKTNGTIDIINPVNFFVKSTINIGNTYKIDGIQVSYLNNDTIPEIIFTADGKIFFYSGPNNYMISKKYSDVIGAFDGLKVRDIDSDGKKEIILGSSALMFEIQSNCYQCMWFSANTSVTNKSCDSINDGSISIIPSGEAPYNYQWSNASTDSTTSNLAPGAYSFTVTDNYGCVISDTINVLQSQLTASFPYSNEYCYPSSNGTASVTINQGTSPYSYHWSNNDTTSGITGLVQGNYAVTVTDANHCIQTHNFTILKDTLYLYNTSSNVACFGTSNGNIHLYTQGAAPYNYVWSSGQSTANLYYIPAGTYTVTVTDAHGCTANSTVTITEPAQILSQTSSTLDDANTPFGEGTATVNVIGGIAPYTLLWNDNFNQTTPTAINLVAGTYVVTITDHSGCIKKDTAIVSADVFINEVSQQNRFFIYPNPSDGLIFLDFAFEETQNVHLDIYNLLGEIVTSDDLKSISKTIVPFDISKLGAGVYNFNISNEKFSLRRQVSLIK